MKGYFDYNATTPMLPAARTAWLSAAEGAWQNPSSLYREAAEVKHRLEDCRERLGELLGCGPERIVFTSGATEANNAILRTLAARLPAEGVVLTSSMEHPSVQVPLRAAFHERVREVGALPDTSLDLQQFHELLRVEGPVLVSMMAANNECGTLLPWREVADACEAKGVPFHCDATQWIGKLPAEDLGRCTYVTGSAHKFGGPKGAGFLVLRDEDDTLGWLAGGPQEEGRRAGTENYPTVEAMVTALEELTPLLDEVQHEQSALRDDFEQRLMQALPGTQTVGGGTARLWNTSMFILPAHDHRKWLARLSQRGFAVSTGSACSAGHEGASQVLRAMGASMEEMKRVLRVSAGWHTTREDWQGLLEALCRVAESFAK